MRPAERHSPRRWLLLSTAAVLLMQTALFVHSAGTRGFATGDGGVKLWQVQGLRHSGRLNAPLDYPGAIYDPAHDYTPFVPPWFLWQNDRPYSEYTSPFIWLSAPLYAWFDHAGLLILPWLSGGLLVIVTAWLAWRLTPNRLAALAPLIVGLGSPLLIYSLEFWEHAPGALLAAFALAAISKSTDSPRRALWLIAAGAASGLGLTMRAELYVFPLAILIGLGASSIRLAISRTTALWRSFFYPIGFLALGGLLTAGPWWLYQLIEWGSPFGPRVQQNVPLLGGEAMLARLGDTTGHNYVMLWPIEGAGFEAVSVLLLSAIGLALGLRLLSRVRHSATRLQHAGWWLLAIAIAALSAVTAWRVAQGIRPNDLLTTFPMILVLLLPVEQSVDTADRSAPHRRFLFATSLAFVLLVLFISPFEGGIQWGPRFLLPVVAPLIAVIVAHLSRLLAAAPRLLVAAPRPAVSAVFAVLLLSSAYVTWQGAQFMRQGQIAGEFMSAVINDSAERVVVTDAWFLPQNAPYTFDDKIWLMAEDEATMFSLIQRLRKETNEPGFIYVSALTWAHIDPGPLLGPRIQETGQRVYVDAPTQYIEISHYQLLK